MFWKIILYIYLFFTGFAFITHFVLAYEARNIILFKKPDYYEIIGRTTSPIQKIFVILQLVFVSAIPILNVTTSLYITLHMSERAKEMSQKALREIGYEGE